MNPTTQNRSNEDAAVEGLLSRARAYLAGLPALSYGRLTLHSRYVLSPLAGYTNLPFRRIVRSVGGVGLATTDLVNARGLLAGGLRSQQLIESTPDDRPFAVQIFGNERGAMCDAARLIESRGVDSVDINMGCPVARVTKGGAGARMMCQVDETVGLVRQVVESVRIPVTVKMRLGWNDQQITAPMLARELEQVGVAAITIHGRTREQGFSGKVQLNGIRSVVEAVERVPIIGNGDVRSLVDAARMFLETGCRGIGIGRGALGNPWIFRQLSEWEATGTWPRSGNFDDRLSLLKKQFAYVEEQHADRAVSMFRKMAHWYLKGMCVPSPLRARFQAARTRDEMNEALDAIIEFGPARGTRENLPELHISVPSGPNELW